MKKLLRLTLLALLLGITATSTSAVQLDDPPPTCNPTDPDCKPTPPLAS